MSSRKRPLTGASQPHVTPSRYAPSTPHAKRALQQRSAVKTRSALSTKHPNTDSVRPDSIRGVLRQLAKISAPVTKKRIVTPGSVHIDKENQQPDNEPDDNEDSVLLHKPNLTFAIEESLEEDDSELPVPPTPSVLPDEDDVDEQPTSTFHNVIHIPVERPVGERSLRRKSRLSIMQSEPITAEDKEDHEGDSTIMTERGRRAISEEATGRLSRYSFGSIRMSDFHSELEIQRDADQYQKTARLDIDDYAPLIAGESFNGDDTRDIRQIQGSPSILIGDDTVNLSAIGDETFRLEVPQVEEEASAREAHTNNVKNNAIALEAQIAEPHDLTPELDVESVDEEAQNTSRRQTLLETATSKTHVSRRKKVKLTRHGTTVPSLPSSVIKRVVLQSYEQQSKRKPKLGRDHMKALEQATEWFFEQAGEDLAAYSNHGRRKKRINADDALLLMRRQKVLLEDGELRKLAKSWLPKDVLEELDLPDTV